MSGLSSLVVSRPTIMPSAVRAAGISPLRSSAYTAIPASLSPLEAIVVEISQTSAAQASQGAMRDSSKRITAVTPQAPPATSSGSSTPASFSARGCEQKRRISRSMAVTAFPMSTTGWGILRGSPIIRSST
ncbi:hypothetical protein D3C85_1394090 [compost metagenome]